MKKGKRNINQILIEELLRQSRERADAQRWNVYSLMLIYSVLVVIIVLILKDVSMIAVGIVAVGGLTSLLLLSYLQNRKPSGQGRKSSRPEDMEISDEACDSRDNSPGAQAPPLTPRELEILTYVVKGNLNKQIAFRMGISEQTVKNHITHILKKLKVEDRSEAAALALQKNWIKQEDEKLIKQTEIENHHYSSSL
jgi:DNA-binding CsgD family transcriptional regulator